MRPMASFIVIGLDGYDDGRNGELDRPTVDAEFRDPAARQLDELRIMIVPIVLGQGRSQFEDPRNPLSPTLLRVRRFDSGTGRLTCRPSPPSSPRRQSVVVLDCEPTRGPDVHRGHRSGGGDGQLSAARWMVSARSITATGSAVSTLRSTGMFGSQLLREFSTSLQSSSYHPGMSRWRPSTRDR